MKTREPFDMKNLLFLLLILFSGCKVKYSFTGVSIPPDIKTISIHYFPNNASTVNPLLSQQFTEEVKSKFAGQTHLTVTDKGGDLDVEGYISNYTILPVGIQGNETAALNRLTITVFVKYANSKDESKNFETTFSRYSDFNSSLDFNAVENDLVKEINGLLAEDIFNRTVVNW